MIKLLDVKLWNRVVLCLTLATMLLSMVDSGLAQGQISQESIGNTIGNSANAGSAFSSLFQSVQSFAGVLLVIGVVIAGLLWMANKPQFAVGVLIGSAVVFGGPYLIGLVNSGLGASVNGNTSSTFTPGG